MDVRTRVSETPVSDLILGFGGAYRLSYRDLGLSNMVFVQIPLSRPEKAPKTILMPSGNNVDVKVRYTLADAIVYCDESTVSVEAQFNRPGQHLGACKNVTDQTSGQVVQSLAVFFRNEQAVAWEDRSIVQEGQCEFVFEHDGTLDRPGNDSAECATSLVLPTNRHSCRH